MAYVCPDCLTAGSLAIVASLTLPPDGRSDDIVVQIVACGQCGFRGAAVYEESRRGALDAESWEHTGYRLGPGALDALAAALARCPAPSDRLCPCDTHRALGHTDAAGRWQEMSGYEVEAIFPMRLAPAR